MDRCTAGMRFVAGMHNDANGSCMQKRAAGKKYPGKQAESTRHTNRHAATKNMLCECLEEVFPLTIAAHSEWTLAVVLVDCNRTLTV